MSVYNPQNLMKVFAELVVQTGGKYEQSRWQGTMPQLPIDIDESNKELIYQTILDATDKYFTDRKPKSWKSLAMQVAVCLSTQDATSMQQSSIETRGRNRLAAYQAGFLDMKDIIALESQEMISVAKEEGLLFKF